MQRRHLQESHGTAINIDFNGSNDVTTEMKVSSSLSAKIPPPPPPSIASSSYGTHHQDLSHHQHLPPPVQSSRPVSAQLSNHSISGSSSNHGLSSSSVSRTDDKNKKPRKRTTRACDQCNQLRTKCDGLQPCAHCQELNLKCEYLRVPQKRGKASQSYLESASRKAAARETLRKAQLRGQQHQHHPKDGVHSSQHRIPSSLAGGQTSTTAIPPPVGHELHNHHPSARLRHQDLPYRSSENLPVNYASFASTPGGNSAGGGGSGGGHPPTVQQQPPLSTNNPSHEQHSPFGPWDYVLPKDSHLHDGNERKNVEALNNQPFQTPSDLSFTASGSTPGGGGGGGGGAAAGAPPPVATTSAGRRNTLPTNLPLLSTISDNSHGSNYGQNPFWYGGGDSPLAHPQHSVPSTTSDMLFRQTHANTPTATVESFYPLNSAHTGAYLPRPSSEGGHSLLNYNVEQLRYPVLAPIVETLTEAKLSLRLAEDLLETYFSRSAHVLAYLVRRTTVLSATAPRKTKSALLFAMLLVGAHDSDNPIVTGTPSSRQAIIAKLMDLTIARLTTIRNIASTGSLDEVITYIQLGTVVSASEFKGSSLRWWNMAWGLAKELKINQEVLHFDPETREEQRRTWWLLYAVDRHLGLCYNRPLVILDSECEDIYQPESDEIWMSDAPITSPENDSRERVRGTSQVVTGEGMFGFFLPLMSILGMIVQVHLAEQNPLMGVGEVCRRVKEDTIAEALVKYRTSLESWSTEPMPHSFYNGWKDYGLYIVHVFHILISVSWDPIELLDTNLAGHPDIDQVANHAITGAASIRRILSVDPDLRLMPFFFGVYLLQGSFLLLALLDQADYEVSPDLLSASEALVHAHEVCVTTLNTEYQRNFRRVMRTTMSSLVSGATQSSSAVAAAAAAAAANLSTTEPAALFSSSPSGSTTSTVDLKESNEETRRRRREILSLYRWTAGGHGIAV